MTDGVDRAPLQQVCHRHKEHDESAERPWGKWTVLAAGVGYKIKLIEVKPGHRLSLQSHRHRAEYWVVVSGRARIVLAGDVLELNPQESLVVPPGAVHRLENPWSDPLVVVEVQRGDILREDDILRMEDDYHRV